MSDDVRAKIDKVVKWFKKHRSEHLKFEKIPNKDRLHPKRIDLCGMLYLDKKTGGDGDIIVGASHDEVYLDCPDSEMAKFTEKDVIYLIRCGVFYDEDVDNLRMFV